MTAHVRRTHHVGFTVASIERSLAFYHGLLGMEITGQQVGTAEYLSRVVGFPGVQLKLAFLRAPGDDHVLELLEYVSHPGEPLPRETNRPGSRHLCFVVDDIGAVFRDLSAKGVEFISPEPALITAGVNRGARAAYFRDPDGHALELFQPAGAGAETSPGGK
jgi:catechol 2,3-dioxygenase-like lactoylglutathione lyase family enzyme